MTSFEDMDYQSRVHAAHFVDEEGNVAIRAETPTSIGTKFADRNLVKMPIYNGSYSINNTGSTGSGQFSVGQNLDGSGQTINISVPANAQDGIRIEIPFWGRVFGVRWRFLSGSCNFSVVVDGVAVAVEGSPSEFYNEIESVTVTAGHDAMAITHQNLSDGFHVAEVIFYSGTATNALQFFGYMVERRWGVNDPPRNNILATGVAGTLTTGQVQIMSSSASAFYINSVRAIKYFNGSGGNVVITIKYGATIIAQPTLATLAEYTYDLLQNTSMGQTSFTHAADTGSAVNFMILGGQL